MSLFSLLGRFTGLYVVSYIVVTILMIFIIALLQLPAWIEHYIPYVLVWVVSFYVLNQYNEKNRRVMTKNERWKVIFLLTLTAVMIGVAFSATTTMDNLPQQLMSLLMGVLIALPVYGVLIWSAEFRSRKRLVQNYPELKPAEESES